MKKKLSLLVWLALMLAGVPHAIAQNVVYDIPDLTTTNTLIRSYQPEVDIIYNNDARSSFIYFDRPNMQAIEAELTLPLDVTDMEIVGDSVYFCANYMGNIYYGFFDVNSTFFGSAPIDVYQIPYYPYDVINGDTLYPSISLSKLEVYQPSANNIHVFMIADVIFNNQLTTDYSVIIEAYYNGTMWNLVIEYEPERVYYFNDITVTDHFLWVVGNKHGATGEYMHGYALLAISNIIGNGFCTFNRLDYWATPDHYYYPVSKPLIETIENDKVAVACYGKIEEVPGIIVSRYNIGYTVTLIDRVMVPNVTLTNEFRDFKYNTQTQSFFLMPDHTASGTMDMMYEFNLGGTSVNLYQSLLEEIHSVDTINDNPIAVVSGITSDGFLGDWTVRPTIDECVEINTMIPDHYSADVFDDCCKTNLLTLKPTYTPVHPSMKEYPIKRNCGIDKKNKKNNN
ncbi:MAG: hypothetical protein IKR33_08000 [Bacteroidales bacterium]|nr:hypothetical protein [Bacteroidales bacterium]